MKRIVIVLLAAFAAAYAFGQDIPEPKIELLIPDPSVNAAGEVAGTVRITFAPGYHGYQNPPTDAMTLPVEIKQVDGTPIKFISYPTGAMKMFAGDLHAMYVGQTDFPVVFDASGMAGDVTFKVDVFYQQCDELNCFMPTTVPLALTVALKPFLPVFGQLGTRSAEPPEPVERDVVADPPPHPKATITFLSDSVLAGSEFPATVTLTFDQETVRFTIDQFVIDLLASGSSLGGTTDALKTGSLGNSMEIIGTDGTDLVSVEYPEGEISFASEIYIQEHSSVIEIPVVLRAMSSEGVQQVSLEVRYQLTGENTQYPPQSFLVTASIDVVEAVDVEAPAATGADSSSSSWLESALSNALESENWALIIPISLLVGLALCLTPCVFPMIPITVSFFSNQGPTGAGKGKSLMLGGLYAFGIAATYGAVGGISAAAGGAVGDLFKLPWFVLLLAAILIALALSMFDVYEIRLPNFIQKNLKGRSGPVGAIIMGLLMGFAAAPCAGALVGAVAVKVADVGSVPLGIGMFATIGIGMGLPFIALATASTGAKAFPKSGGWLKTVKAVLGFVVLYFAFGYVFQGIGFRSDELRTQIGWMVIYGGFAGYLLFFDKSDPTRSVGIIKGVTAVALGLLGGLALSQYRDIALKQSLEGVFASNPGEHVSVTPAGEINWVTFNEENFEDAMASGLPIMIDGTADWCPACHEIEKRVFKSPAGLAALSRVYVMKIDWSTGVDKKYEKMTKERFKIVGLPHIVFMKPGGVDEFAVQNIRSADELKEYLARAGAKS
ncbi:MAG: thioredoxin family protein [Armatimonadetes bacterium]|nr:thioredoxin family protein [Armatimonadota bacterium]